MGNHSVVTQVGSTRTPTLEALEAALQALPDGTSTTVRYYNIGDQVSCLRKINV